MQRPPSEQIARILLSRCGSACFVISIGCLVNGGPSRNRGDLKRIEKEADHLDSTLREESSSYPLESLRSVRPREKSIIIAIACKDPCSEAPKTTHRGISIARDAEKTGMRTRELCIAYIYACTRVYAKAPHGATRRPTERPSTEKKKRRKDESSRYREGKDVGAKRRWEKSRRRNKGVATSDSNYLELQGNDRPIDRPPPELLSLLHRRERYLSSSSFAGHVCIQVARHRRDIGIDQSYNMGCPLISLNAKSRDLIVAATLFLLIIS